MTEEKWEANVNVIERLGQTGVVPVVVIEDVKNAIPTAEALLKGGMDVMEITLRTKAGLDSIRTVAANCPDVLVGAGTVLTLDQCKACVEAGAKFIVSPGFDRALVKWCVENGVAVTPGCVTPTEITEALELGIKVVKFFPANVYGGLPAMKALAAPFGNVKFIPTGGANAQNLSEFIAAPFVHAVGGSWLCDKGDIASNNFDRITALCAEAIQIALGFEFAHLGINTRDDDESMGVVNSFSKAFGFAAKQGNSSNFAGSGIEVMKSMYLGKNGHIAIKTNSVSRAIAYLAKKGYEMDMDTAKFKDDKMIAVYLKEEIGGFAIHLLQK